MKREITAFHTKPRKPLKRSGFKKQLRVFRAKLPCSAFTTINGVCLVCAKKHKTLAPKQKKSKYGRKPPTIPKLKKELDRLFSLYIRGKYPKKCYTCSYTGNLQNGHFVSRQYLATRWDERNCRPQCAMCNIWGRGMILDFEENLKKELGADVVESLKASRHQIIKLDRQWYEAEILKYKSFKLSTPNH